MTKEELFLEVAKLAARHGLRDELIWTEDLAVAVDVSDLFYWACADAEDITEENLPMLRQAIEDVEAVDSNRNYYAAMLFAARVRNLRPQGKFISDYVRGRDDEQTEQLKALFLALPERPVDIGNPYTPEGKYEYTPN